MIIVNSRLLDVFAWKHAETRKSLATWKKTTEIAIWKNRKDVLISFPNARMLANNRARFEIVHNKYRLIAEVIYDAGLVSVRFIGTHHEYDRIDPTIV